MQEEIVPIFTAGADALSAWQMAVRAVAVFVIGWLLVRLGGRRAFSKASALDIILAVVAGSNLSRAMTGNAPFVETVAATAALVLLYRALRYAAYPSDRLGKLLKGGPVELVRGGEIHWKQMRWHGIGRGDLEEGMRKSGVRRLEEVEVGYLDRSGDITIVTRETQR